jgi:hypothetical protein
MVQVLGTPKIGVVLLSIVGGAFSIERPLE